MSSEVEKRKIRIIGASAGTGKTTRLASEYVRVFGKKEKQGVDLGVIATTFTRKSAEELLERVRRMLFERGQWIVAQSLLCGYAGTVHSIALRLLRDYALEAGFSPVVDVIDEPRRELIFKMAAEPALEVFFARTCDAVERFGWKEWQVDVLNGCYLAMENNLGAETLALSANQSMAFFEKHLPIASDSREAEGIDFLFGLTLAETITRLNEASDSTLETRRCRERLRELHRAQRAGFSCWADWAVCTKLKAGAKSKHIVSQLIELAALHPYHPRLREDVSLITREYFQCIEQSLSLYEQYKRERGLVDFCDLENQAFQLLLNKTAATTLSNQLRLLLVDEFQDTSPSQMELFTRLGALAQESVWVGDEKQTIYGFRGANPALLETAVARLSTNREQLRESYRSRAEIVGFVNDVFSQAFPSIGIDRENVLISEVHRGTPQGLGPALNAWWLAGKSWTEACASLAKGVANLLQGVNTINVEERDTGILRPARGADIAILCLTNDRCIEVAKALSTEGLRVATERPGLLLTPEASLAFACLRYLVDPSDSLAAAEILQLHGLEWLSDWLEHGRDDVERKLPELARLRQGTRRLPEWTPLEALDFALVTGGVLTLVKQWSNNVQRVSNLDALRGLAIQYEEVCKIQRSCCTPAGFVAFLYSNIEDGGAQPINPDPQAVRVVTYHGAKGLEWPIVILMDLQEPKAATVFGVSLESDFNSKSDASSVEEPWLRFCPWPYGAHSTNVYLDATAARSNEMHKATRRRTSELIRLLYVGMTRARDNLFFAARAERSNTGWLDILKASDGKAILALPKEPGSHTVVINETLHRFEVAQKDYADSDTKSEFRRESLPRFGPFFSRSAEVATCLPLRLVPSAQQENQDDDCSDEQLRSVRVLSIGNRLPLSGVVDVELVGEVIHRFIAADGANLRPDERALLGRELLKRWGISQIESEDLVLLSSRLDDFVLSQYGNCTVYKECPVQGRFGLQRVTGRIDMLIQIEDGFAILDHKSFPGPYNHWVKKALSYSKQLDLYGTLVAKATGAPIIEKLIHMPVVGKVLLLRD